MLNVTATALSSSGQSLSVTSFLAGPAGSDVAAPTVPSAFANAQTWIVAQAEKSGPMGAEFGKAAPVGLFVIVALLLVVLLLGFAMNKRIRRMERRRAFADKHGIDLFDAETLERRMKEEGFDETAGRSAMFARTEVPVTDERFEPSSGTLTGPDAIDAERRASERSQERDERDSR
ncbi:hypothetical protein [Corynebacterium resistens]|uniref:hypothetical protein n=1 Tax=Corynebacterium resistens TaxID=258224 RepID=UPI002351FED1|nr:hypothetical protein [Corynebacterium resistens]